MKIKHLFRLSLLAILMACSSGIKVYFDYDKEADFGAAKTFAFLPWNDEYSKIISELNKRRILDDITNEMTKRGIARVESTTEADLTVHVFVALEEKTAVTAYTDYYNPGGFYYGRPGWGYGYGYGYGTATTRYSETPYVEGTMVIDVADVKTSKLIWQGVGVGTVDQDLSPKKREKNLKYVIGKIFKGYPKKQVK